MSEKVGAIADMYGDEATVTRHATGVVIVTFESGGDEAALAFTPLLFDEFRELLDRAAMPGQVSGE